jgi:flagellar secretion chaperone FliS
MTADQAYLQHEVLHADPLRLVEMCYRAALDAVAKARVHLQRSEIRERSRQITRANGILAELAHGVDRDKGGEIAARLLQLYDYVQQLLIEANASQTEAPLAEAEKLLRVLLEAWESIADGQADSAAPDHILPAAANY